MKHFTYLFIAIFMLFANAVLAQEGRTIILTESEYQELLRKSQSCPISTPAAIEEERVRKSKSGFSLRLGGGMNYMYGIDTKNNETFSTDHASWYGKAMLGYVANADQKGAGTVLGAFVVVGNTSKNSIQKFLDEGVTNETATPASQNLFYQAELGAILFQTLRISSGAGYQEFQDASNNEQKVNYYSTTGGLQLGSRYMKLTFDVNFLYGRDLEETVLRPMVGISFQL
jgi:hypothetical protein